MSKIHHIISGSNWFFITIVTKNRELAFKDEGNRNILKNSLEFCRKKYDASIVSYGVMFDHFHFVIGFADGSDLPKFMHSLKRYTARQINIQSGQGGAFWQEDYWDHGIRNNSDLVEKVEYIHKNLFEIAEDPEEWPCNSYHNYHCQHSCWFEVDLISL